MVDPESTPSALPNHIPALDGVRGIAILLVFVYHAFYVTAGANENAFDGAVSKITNGGWIGVDLFFVLSGFLITGILLDSRGGGAATLIGFYGRRALRILPLYFAFLLTIMYALPFVLGFYDDPGIQILRGNQGWYWTFTLNISVALDPLQDLGRFSNGHLWSLNVEEHFYLVWPFVILFVPRRALVPVLLAFIVAAPVFRYAVLEGAFPDIWNGFGAYVLMPARMDALALGGLVALLLRSLQWWRRARPFFYLGAVIAPMILAAILLEYGQLRPFDRWTQIFGYSSVAALFAVAVAQAVMAAPGSVVREALSHRALRFLGRYSYAIYVIHWEIVVELARRWTPGEWLGTNVPGRLLFAVVAGAASLALAWLSWHVLEKRFLSLKQYVPYTRPEAAASLVSRRQEPAPE